MEEEKKKKNRSLQHQLNMRVPMQTIERVNRLRDLLLELNGFPHSQADAVGFASQVAIDLVEKELAKKAQTKRPGKKAD